MEVTGKRIIAKVKTSKGKRIASQRRGSVMATTAPELSQAETGCAGIKWIDGVSPATMDVNGLERMERVLKDSELRYRHIFETAKDGIFIVDAKTGVITDVNSTLINILGYSHEDLVKKKFWEIDAFKDIEDGQVVFDILLKNEYIRYENLHLKAKCGRAVQVKFVGNVVYLVNDEKLIQCCVICITEGKQAKEVLHESKERFRTLVENAVDIIIILNADGTMQYASPSVSDFFGCKPTGLVGRNVREFIHPDDLPAAINAVVHITQHQHISLAPIELRVRHQDGTWRILELLGRNLLNDPAIAGVIINAREITDRKGLEGEIKTRLAELEAVNQISIALRAVKTLDEMLPRMLDTTLGMLHASQGSIWLYDNIKDELRVSVMRGWSEETGNPIIPPEKPGEGITGFVFATGQPFTTRDFHMDLHLPEAVRLRIPPGSGGTAVPIRAGEKVIGVFMIIVPLPRELMPSEVNLLAALSEVAGNAIQRTMLYQQTEQRLQHLIALSDIDRTITSSFDLNLSLNTLLSQVIAQLGITAASVLLLNPSSQMLEYAAGRGFRTKAIKRARQRLGEGYAGRAALERNTIIISNISEQPEEDSICAKLLADEAFVSYYGVPLMAKGQVKGVLEIFHRALLEPEEEWLDFLKALAGQAAIAIDNATMFESLQRSNTELTLAYDATIEGWSRALDLRDRETEGHTMRVTETTVKLARAFDFTEEELVPIRWGAQLHDIGKMGVPDEILLKPGPLTDEEWVIMKKHPTLAYEMLYPIRYLRSALDVPYLHHEKYDGTGYPLGLKGDQIPLVARIFAVVDVWDALSSDRPYRAAWSAERVHEHIRLLSGNHFDPRIVNVCFESGVLVTQP